MSDEPPTEKKTLFTPSLLIQLLFGGLIVWGIIHGVRVGGLENLWRSWGSLPYSVGVFSLLAFFALWRAERAKFTIRDFLPAVVASLSGALIAHGIVLCVLNPLIASAFDLLLWVTNVDNPSSRAALVVAAVAFAGSFLFWIRLNWRSTYGATEALVGIAIAAHRILNPPKDSGGSIELLLALLTASVYLIVRGLDNVHQGLTKDRIDPFATKIVKWIRTRPPSKPQQAPRGRNRFLPTRKKSDGTQQVQNDESSKV